MVGREEFEVHKQAQDSVKMILIPPQVHGH